MKLREKEPELWILHQGNVLSVKQFDRNITVLKHLPYSSDLASYDFYLFLKIKSMMFQNLQKYLKDVTAKTVKITEIFNHFSENDLQNCFDSIYNYLSTQKRTILKIVIDFLNLLNKKKCRHSLFVSNFVLARNIIIIFIISDKFHLIFIQLK